MRKWQSEVVHGRILHLEPHRVLYKFNDEFVYAPLNAKGERAIARETEVLKKLGQDFEQSDGALKRPYLGVELFDVMRRHSVAGCRPGFKEFGGPLRVAYLVVHAVKRLHDAGFVHCKLNNSTILLDENTRTASLIDFENARPLSMELQLVDLAQTGWLLLETFTLFARDKPGCSVEGLCALELDPLALDTLQILMRALIKV